VKNFIPRIPPGDGIALAARFVKESAHATDRDGSIRECRGVMDASARRPRFPGDALSWQTAEAKA
jgi:hypothetical protein